MTLKIAYTAAALVAALSLAATPAAAQGRRAEGRDGARARPAQSAGNERGARGGRAVARPAERRQTTAAQQAPQSNRGRQTSAAQQAPQSNRGRQYQRPQAGSRGNAAPAYSAPQNRSGGSQARPYAGSQRGSAGYAGDAGQRAVPRSNGGYRSPAYRSDDRRGYPQYGGGNGRYGNRAYVRPPHFQPYRPLYFSRPYYGFRPHVHIGFGVWLGVSVPYPWAYFGTYVPRVYGYYDRGYYGVSAGVQQYGGLSFDIQPSDADLYVDGEYVGSVGTFTPYGEPLTLWPGVHRIAIVRDGFRTMEWEITVQRGQVIPYRGMLARW